MRTGQPRPANGLSDGPAATCVSRDASVNADCWLAGTAAAVVYPMLVVSSQVLGTFYYFCTFVLCVSQYDNGCLDPSLPPLLLANLLWFPYILDLGDGTPIAV